MSKLFSLFFLLYVVTVAANDCSITLPGGVKENGPVILTNNGLNYQLFKPTGKVTTLRMGTYLLLACPSSRSVENSFKSINASSLELVCQNGVFVNSMGQSYALNSLECNHIPYSTLQPVNRQCSNNNGLIYNAGFMVNNRFYGPVFEICHRGGINTLYTHNTINGAASAYAITTHSRRQFTADITGYSTAVLNNLYLQTEQYKRFDTDKYFGPGQKIIKKPNFLARGHLTPDADFIFGYEKLSTYYFANVAPEFQLINGGNWLRVEELGRYIAEVYGDDIESYNGYKEVLQLKNTSGVLVDVDLDDTIKIEAPKYFYKVLLHKASNSAIVYITVNNPYIDNGPAQEFCTNVCKISGFEHKDFPILSKGYTFCCGLNDFKTTVHSLPAEVEAKNLLNAWFS